jgi:DNA topoisomerase IB
LATLRKEHVRVQGDSLIFDYDAKSGQHRLCEVVDPDVREVVVALRRRRAPASEELLAYKDPDRGWVDVKSSDINGYVQEHLGDGFSAKDFRTWVGTVLAAAKLAAQEPADTEAGRRRAVAAVVKDVAEHLGNTPAVARSAYIDPIVVEQFEAEETVAHVLEELDDDDLSQGVPEELEQAVLTLIDRARRRRHREQRARRRPKAA